VDVTARDFLAEADRLGCEVLTDGKRVGLRGPRAALTQLTRDLERLKPDLLRVLRDGTTDRSEGCACLVCRPDLWPEGFEEVVATWPKRDQRRFAEAVRVRRNAGLPSEQAERLSYLDGLADIRRRAQRKG
jgi:hypothetical protein